MHGLHRKISPLTMSETAVFDRAISAYSDPFEAWLAGEIFTGSHVPSFHRALGVAGFITGGTSGLVTYYLAKDLMKIFGANSQVGSAVGVMVLIPRIALGGNALQDCILKALHDYSQPAKLPRKNNHAFLRGCANGFVYLSSAALGVMGGYILWNNLPYSQPLKIFFLPSILIGNSVVNVRPFLDANDAFFAQYSQGVTPEIQEKRMALMDAIEVALNEIRAYNAEQFESFYHDMISPCHSSLDVQTQWQKLLSIAEHPQQAPHPPKTTMMKARGYFGWFLSFLSSLTNIQISYAEAKWLAEAMHTDDKSVISLIGIVSSILCITAYAVLCAGPTQKFFENQTNIRGWEPTHAWCRQVAFLLAFVFAFASAIPNASWPIVLGTNDYEKSLAGPAFLSPGSLYLSACLILLNRCIDTYDRAMGQSRVIDHMDYLAKLESLPPAVAQLPDQMIEQWVPTESLLLVRYRNKRSEPRSHHHAEQAIVQSSFSV